jgi:hypothetical protein
LTICPCFSFFSSYSCFSSFSNRPCRTH